MLQEYSSLLFGGSTLDKMWTKREANSKFSCESPWVDI